MMEAAWRRPASGGWPDWMGEWDIPFAETIDGTKKYVVSSTLGRIDEYAFVVHPVIAGHGPTLFAGLRERMQLELVERQEFRSGAVSLLYRPTAA